MHTQIAVLLAVLTGGITSVLAEQSVECYQQSNCVGKFDYVNANSLVKCASYAANGGGNIWACHTARAGGCESCSGQKPASDACYNEYLGCWYPA